MPKNANAAPGWTPGSGVRNDCARNSTASIAAPATPEAQDRPPIAAAAREQAAAWTRVLISRRSFAAEDLRKASDWAFGAFALADRLGDRAAADFLRDLDKALFVLSLLQEEAKIAAELVCLLERITQGQEIREDRRHG